MTRTPILAMAATLLLAGSFTGARAADKPPAKRPNIIIVLGDDIGFNSIGFQGSEIKTPRLDAWSKDAVRFSHYYSNVVCSPTRAGLMTGRWPIRFGMMRGTVEPGETFGLPASEETIAEALARGGYKERAIIGKWHLGDQKRAYIPTQNGFNYFFGHLTGGIGYFIHEREGVNELHRNETPVLGTNGQYLTHMLTAEVLKYIDARAADREPFLLYLAPFNAHQPNEAPPEYVAAQSHIADPTRRMHGAMVGALDTMFGQIIDALQAKGMADNTVVMFTTDNGGPVRYSGANANAPLRGGKGQVFEGGMRVPAAIRWKAGGVDGGRVVDARVGYIDVMPTVLAAAGIKPGPNALDGVDLLPAARRGAAIPARDWYGYIGNRRRTESLAIIRDGWKLIRIGPDLTGDTDTGEVSYQLFEIDKDPNEKIDLADRNPAKVAELRARLLAFHRLEPADGIRRRPIDPNWKPSPNWTPPG